MVIVLSILAIGQSCSKYNEAIPLEFDAHKPKIGTPEYYEALRSYKKSDHAICFGWWGQSGTPDAGPNMSGRYEGLPDSMDIVSLWGGFPPMGSEAWNEMQVVRKKKGTKFVWCMFGSGVARLMKKNTPELLPQEKSKWVKADIFKAIDFVAQAMNDTIEKYQLDGFDLDYEPSEADERDEVFGNDGLGTVNGGKESIQYLFKALSKYLGPKSNTDKVLLIDGYYELGILDYIDFYVQQAYSSTSFQALESRLTSFGKNEVPPEKFVVTENMQQFGPKGTTFNVNGVNIGSILGMATWNSTKGRKGGFGGYIIEQDALSNPSMGLYYYLRMGIQIQNPAPY